MRFTPRAIVLLLLIGIVGAPTATARSAQIQGRSAELGGREIEWTRSWRSDSDDVMVADDGREHLFLIDRTEQFVGFWSYPDFAGRSGIDSHGELIPALATDLPQLFRNADPEVTELALTEGNRTSRGVYRLDFDNHDPMVIFLKLERERSIDGYILAVVGVFAEEYENEMEAVSEDITWDGDSIIRSRDVSYVADAVDESDTTSATSNQDDDATPTDSSTSSSQMTIQADTELWTTDAITSDGVGMSMQHVDLDIQGSVVIIQANREYETLNDVFGSRDGQRAVETSTQAQVTDGTRSNGNRFRTTIFDMENGGTTLVYVEEITPEAWLAVEVTSELPPEETIPLIRESIQIDDESVLPSADLLDM